MDQHAKLIGAITLHYVCCITLWPQSLEIGLASVVMGPQVLYKL